MSLFVQDSKLLLLSPKTDPKEDLFGEDDLQWMKEEGISHTTQQITLTYSNFTMNAILRSVLPANVSEVPTAFETVGHIAHLNIRDDILEYKTVIGMFLYRCCHGNRCLISLVVASVLIPSSLSHKMCMYVVSLGSFLTIES